MASSPKRTRRKEQVEVLLVELIDPSKNFENLIRFFFSFHDPTTLNRQGADRGLAYASFIFCSDNEQIEIANRVKAELQKLIDCGSVTCFLRARVQTKVVNTTTFIEASETDQGYSLKNPSGYW
jgi:peptide-methionine (S)-S-oxide reductase